MFESIQFTIFNITVLNAFVKTSISTLTIIGKRAIFINKYFDNQIILRENTIKYPGKVIRKPGEGAYIMLEKMRPSIANLFGVEIPTEDLTEIATVGDVIEFLKTKGIEA